MKLTAIHQDTCLSCYWLGSDAAHLQVPVHRNMTLQELKDALEQERMNSEFGGSDERTQDTHSQYQDFQVAAYKAIKAITQKTPGASLLPDLEEDLEEEQDGADLVYAYFLFVDED